MGCLILLGISSIVTPRVILFLTWLFSDYLSHSFETRFLPFIGFLFLPWTTLWCAYTWHNGGTFNILDIIILMICISADGGSDRSITTSRQEPAEG